MRSLKDTTIYRMFFDKNVLPALRVMAWFGAAGLVYGIYLMIRGD